MSGSIRPRKYDFVRNLVGRSKKSLPGRTSTSEYAPSRPSQSRSASDVLPALSAPSSRAGQKILADTWDMLTSEEQLIIRPRRAFNTQDIGTVVDEAYRAAQGKKQICEDKRWRWTLRGRNIVLREEAQRVLLWLDRFKSVGDVVANVDPVHAGLPWAWLRIMLDMAVSESHQMAALLTGMSLALCLANRLQAYFEYFRRLPAALTTANLERALVNLYAHLLRFIATAIRTYETNVATRSWRALWETSMLLSFESEGDKLAARVGHEADNCDRELSTQDRESARQWKQELDKALQKLDDIQGIRESVDALIAKVDLAKLKAAKGATYNSHKDEHTTQCLGGTRTELLNQITAWVDDPDGKRIFWLCGMAGTGKSTISRTVADSFHRQQRLGASFFFKRGEGDRGNASRFFPTIAMQLADTIPGLGRSIAEALDADSFLCERNLQEQFEKLLSRPLIDAATSGSLLADSVIAVDGLDECERVEDIRMILRLLAQVEAIGSLRLRIFVTSRPELPIQLGFKDMDRVLHQDVMLEEMQAKTIENDIRAYFDHEFAEIRAERLLKRPYDPLPADWPTENDMRILVDMAVPLFIFASTVCRFVSEYNPRKRLGLILQQQHNPALPGLAKTYMPILDQILNGKDEDEQKKHIADFRAIVGPIIILADPLSIASLAKLLQLDHEDVSDRLEHLHSVLHIPSSLWYPVRPLHLSFRDFLIDPLTRSKTEFWIDERHTHNKLAEHCLQRLNSSAALKNDICSVENPGTRRAEIGQEQVTRCINPDVAYACCYWAWHVVESGQHLCDDDHVHQFLQQHFLHWLEVLSWLGRLSSAIDHITQLQSRVKVDAGADMLIFLDDALLFVLQIRHIVDLAPLQLYYSALIFAPTESVIAETFKHEIPRVFSLLPNVYSKRGAELVRFEGHDSYVFGVAHSLNGVVASASYDRTVRLWNAGTGEEMQKLEGHNDAVRSVAFSPDGSIVASGSADKTVRMWNVSMGEQTQELRGHEDSVEGVAFSPDGKIVASASWDQTVRLWNAQTGKETQKLEGHTAIVTAVAFSPNGSVVASASWDQTVRLWNTQTGKEIQKLGHTMHVEAVAFPPDGSVVASGSADGTVRIWNTRTGEQIKEFKAHDGGVTGLAFFPHGCTVVSASGDRIVRVWDALTGRQKQELKGHDDRVLAVACSPDEKRLASASRDGTARMWSTSTGAQRQPLEGHNDHVTDVVFSQEGSVVASASFDRTVRLWDAWTCKELKKLEGHDDIVWAVAFSPDGSVVVSGSDDDTVRMWNVSTGEQIQELRGHGGRVAGVAFSSDGEIVASASWDRTARLWNAATGKEMQKLEGHDGPVRAVVFSPNRDSVASASYDNTVRIWDAWEGKETKTLRGHDDVVWTVAFSSDGSTVASASWDWTVRLWNAQTGEEMQKFITTGSVSDLRFSNDGNTLRTDNAGSFDVSLHNCSRSDNVVSAAILELNGQWVYLSGEGILWLPHEYRGTCSAAHGDMLVIGQASGAMSFFRL